MSADAANLMNLTAREWKSVWDDVCIYHRRLEHQARMRDDIATLLHHKHLANLALHMSEIDPRPARRQNTNPLDAPRKKMRAFRLMKRGDA